MLFIDVLLLCIVVIGLYFYTKTVSIIILINKMEFNKNQEINVILITDMDENKAWETKSYFYVKTYHPF